MLRRREASGVGEFLCEVETGGWICLADDALGKAVARGDGGGTGGEEVGEDRGGEFGWDCLGVC